MKTVRRWLRQETGSAAAELALLTPLLALILGGILEFGRVVQTAQVATNAAREGARYAAVSDPGAATYTLNYLTDVLGGRTDVTVGAVTISGGGTVGNSVTVSVPVTVSIGMPVIQNVLGASVALTGSATMEVSQ